MRKEKLLGMEPSELARILRIPIVRAYLEIEVRDKDGKVIVKRKQESHSWQRWAYHLIFSELAAVNAHTDDGLGVTDTGGSVRSGAYAFALHHSLTQKANNYGYTAPADSALIGIVVGTGIGAESFEDHALGTLIASGEAAGELSYSASAAYAVTTVDTTKKNTLVRYFNNNSGGAITVNEVGLYIRAYVDNDLRYVMTARDLVSPGVEVVDTGQLKVTYTIELIYPS